MSFKQSLKLPGIFIFLTYFITWVVYIPLAFAAHGFIKFELPRWIQVTATLSPGIAVIILTATIQGKTGLKNILHKIIYWRINIKWYLFAILIPAICIIPSLLIYHFILKKHFEIKEWYLPLILIFIFLPFSPLWEEIGWRGYLLPKLQKKHSPINTSVILGLIWGIWHIPIYLTLNPEGNKTWIYLIYFILGSIPITILTVWIYNNVKGFLLPLIIFHASINATFSLFGPLPTGELRPFIYTMLLILLIAIIVCIRTKGRLGYMPP